MIKHLLQANRRRVPIKYALIAAGLAVVSVVALESAGTALTSSYSGLGGKLAPATSGAPELAPVAAPDIRRTLQ
jgi:hypothetical protein